jgi:hypothetical protein
VTLYSDHAAVQSDQQQMAVWFASCIATVRFFFRGDLAGRPQAVSQCRQSTCAAQAQRMRPCNVARSVSAAASNPYFRGRIHLLLSAPPSCSLSSYLSFYVSFVIAPSWWGGEKPVLWYGSWFLPVSCTRFYGGASTVVVVQVLVVMAKQDQDQGQRGRAGDSGRVREKAENEMPRILVSAVELDATMHLGREDAGAVRARAEAELNRRVV